ncbi:plexin-b [Dermatophagoides farinae]|uniref:Plexin-b n=1 Tax=Dermatophagoides farinae TaxID=6954 RepID=A0A9D4SJT8_DERFA|nr:plexin-b [Dermatophagoides farinae]
MNTNSTLKSYTTSNKSINFTHVELDPITGNIYVGASNWIFQLDSNTLRVEHAVRTGPIRDSPSCPPSDCSGVDPNLVQITNNVNKILLIEPYARMLIVCGSVHQGACTRHRLEDISQHEDLIPLPVASNDENSSTIAFVGPARYFGVQLTPILYVAATDSRIGPYRDMVPAISGRSLESSRLFTIIDRGFADSARVDISSNIRDYFLVNYVYGFYANDYVYFAQIQRRSYLRTLEEMGYVTRLSRVCVSDAGFHTYTELTLECIHHQQYSSSSSSSTTNNGRYHHHHHHHHQHSSKMNNLNIEQFNLLQDAILIKAGSDLSDSLNIERGSLVLIGVFANSHDHTNRPNGGKSALCVYPIADIEQRFAENIHLCYNGSVYSRNMDYIAGSVNQCPEPGAGNVFNFCNEAVKLNGSIPLRTQASIVFDDGHTILTAIAAGITGQHTVAFLGTNYGSIKKVLLTRGDYGQQFDEITIDPNQPILADLFVDAEQNPRYLIASSPYKVVKFPVETCVQHNSCDQCLQARNPYCGWCSLQKRCTIKSECLYHSNNNNVFSTPRWLSLETSQCIDFQAIKPEFMARNLFAPVELIINQLPPLPYGANYLCVFEQQGQPIPATVTRNGLICQTPAIQLRPKIPIGHDHINVNVAVRSSETDTDFIHRSFIYFDCSVHKSCKSCVMSAWDCNWCMHENLCTYNTSLCTRRMIVGENSAQNSLIKGVQHCPSFNIEQEIVVPNGQRRELSVEIRNLIPSSDGFQCIIEIEQAKANVQARISDNKIICNELMLSYQEEIGQQRASLTVLWNSDTFIDRTNFTIYKCQYLGAYAGRADCSLCQTRDNKFGCVWCLNQCLYNDQCTDLPIINTCPPPRIDYIHPISGPIEGGTLVSIEGSNLGSSFDEIKDRVSIGGIPCEPIQYNVSIRIVCRTGASMIGPQSAFVIIGNRAGVTRAQEKFQYKIIELIDVNPKIGPQSGGTRIYLSGKNLNIGSNVAIYLDDLPCYVERALASSFQMSCRTSAAPYPSYVVTRLILMIDGANYTLANPFLYTADPTIDRIEPLQSFFSGGRMITVTGSQFTSIQQPRMLVFVPRITQSHHNHHQQKQINHHYPTVWTPTYNGHNNNNNNHHHHHHHHYIHNNHQQLQQPKMDLNNNPNQGMINIIDQYRLINESICTIHSPIKMLCQSPMINGDLQLLASNLILELDKYYPHVDSNMLYVSDPIIYSLNNGQGKSITIGGHNNNDNHNDNVLPFKGDVIIVEGENLAVLLLNEFELNITIGQQRCNLTSVNMRQIICQPPVYPPAPTDELGRRNSIELPAIVLKIGNMRRHLGYIYYSDYFYAGFNDQQFELLIVISILIGTILTIVSIIILAAYKNKQTEAEREYKRIQLQMDTLENNVRAECKQAFAELQTDILHSNGLLNIDDLQTIPLPTHDERTFLLRMFFVSGIPWPLPNDNNTQQQQNYQRPSIVIEQFEQLLMNRTFLLILIDTLEKQTKKSFSITERMRFASLLMITLLDRMEYSFDIMRQLLSQLIDRFATNKHSTLELIKCNETIVEKMLIDWLSICLYKYAREVSSGPLFLLFSAIKHQIDKGPVDFVTGNSRYSLSEEKLLREQIDYKTLTVHVFLDDKLQQTLPISINRLSNANRINNSNNKQRRWIANQSTSTTLRSINNNRIMKKSIIMDYHQTTTNDHHSINNNNNVDDIIQNHSSSTPVQDFHINGMAVTNNNNNANNNNGRGSGSGSGSGDQTSSTDVTTMTGIDKDNDDDNDDYDDGDGGYYPCRILDCDTITQVKQKIIDSLYRYVPNIERPSINDVQLYWRCLKPRQQQQQQQQQSTSSTLRRQQINQNIGDYNNGTETSFNSDYQSQNIQQQQQQPAIMTIRSPKNANSNQQSSTTAVLYQDLYGVASLMSKNDADRIYNASRHSNISSLEMADILLDDYDHSTQILTANEAIWRRLNTISHYVNNYRYHHESNIISSGDGGGVAGNEIYDNSITNDDDDENTEFHLYEQIPADRNSNHDSSFYGYHQDNIYNLSSETSSTRMRPPMAAVINYGLSSLQPQQQQQQQRYESYIYHQRSPSIFRPEEIYVTQNGNQRKACGGNTLLTYQTLTNSTPNSSTLFTPNHQSRLLLQPKNQLLSSSTSSYRLNSTTIINNQHHRNNRRSFARNVYDRLSLFMKRTSTPKRQQRRINHTLHNNQRLLMANSDYGQQANNNDNYSTVASSNNQNDEQRQRRRHNIWHLVKPSSLINDCIIGVSGGVSFLQNHNDNDDYDELMNNHKSYSLRNLRTIRQRRALRRRQRHCFTKQFPKTNAKSSSQLAAEAAASAALSSSQMNLEPIINGGGGGFNNSSVSMNSLAAISTPKTALQPTTTTTTLTTATIANNGSPLSILTTSASSLLASIFCSNSQHQQQQPNDTLNSLSTYLINRSIPEIYLTRLLTTKGTIQQYVDDVFHTIFTVNERLPIAIKWLFDFFDQEAMKNSITDSDILAQWKSNSLILRFWVTILRMPEILFDIQSNISIDVCLDVLAQNLIDTCRHHHNQLIMNDNNNNNNGNGNVSNGSHSSSNNNNNNNDENNGKIFNKDPNNSSSSKLLYARDNANYQKIINEYYKDISLLPSIKESDIIAYMKDVSKTFEGKIHKDKSLDQLLTYCIAYKEQIFQSLSNEPKAQQEHLHLKFETIIYAAMATTTAATTNVGGSHQQHQHQQQPSSSSSSYGCQQQRSNGISR